MGSSCAGGPGGQLPQPRPIITLTDRTAREPARRAVPHPPPALLSVIAIRSRSSRTAPQMCLRSRTGFWPLVKAILLCLSSGDYAPSDQESYLKQFGRLSSERNGWTGSWQRGSDLAGLRCHGQAARSPPYSGGYVRRRSSADVHRGLEDGARCWCLRTQGPPVQAGSAPIPRQVTRSRRQPGSGSRHDRIALETGERHVDTRECPVGSVPLERWSAC